MGAFNSYRAVILVVGIASLAAACAQSSEDVPAVSTPDSQIPIVGPDFVEIDVDRRSTRPDIAWTNLNSQVDARRLSLARRPTDLAVRRDLVGLLLARAHYRGAYADFAEADAVTQDAIEQRGTDPEARVLRARYLSAVHRFSDAETELERAEALSSSPDRSSIAERRWIDAVALGRGLGDALPGVEDVAAEYPSYQSLTTLASVQAALGQYDAADRSFRDAVSALRGVSPFPLAWVAFQRGVMWGEMADRPDLARPLYEEAVRRLPGYVVANVHLAELESEQSPEAAISRMEALAAETDDPEPAGYLAELIQETEPERSEASATDARTKYDELLARYPEAFADHGSEFFAGVGGDPERALALARANLTRRENSRAFIVGLEAAEAAADPAALCEVADQARRSPHPSVSLRRALVELGDACD